MAVNVTGKKPMFGNRRSHALNATRHKQKLNLQVVTLEDGTKVRLTAREKRTLLKNDQKVEEENTNEQAA
ncbi:MAG: bL28 family ribosomal protein [Bacilli bacterium]